MNVEILPAILAKNITEVREKLKCIKGLTDWVHLDVMDGRFAANASWNSPDDLMHMRVAPKIEMHLMVMSPGQVYLDWIRAGASRIVWHLEAAANHSEMIADLHRHSIEAGIAINPETSISALEPLLSSLDRVVIMANTPGASGQSFREDALEKIKALRAKWPKGVIEVDIGINPETAKKVLDAGANVLIAGSALFNAPTPQEGLEALRVAIK